MSASGKSFHLNSVNYGDGTHNLYVVNVRMPRLPEMRVDIEPLANANGAVSWGKVVGPRIWQLDCMILAASTAAVETSVAAVVADLLAAHVAGPSAFYLDSHSSDVYNARPMGAIESALMITGESFSIQIIAPNPSTV